MMSWMDYHPTDLTSTSTGHMLDLNERLNQFGVIEIVIGCLRPDNVEERHHDLMLFDLEELCLFQAPSSEEPQWFGVGCPLGAPFADIIPLGFPNEHQGQIRVAHIVIDEH
jgi:hypothetical protein